MTALDVWAPPRGTPRPAPRPSATYLPALDGLRAIAVGTVVAYHLGFSWARGGFLGVDLFFVISGYLITGQLLDEHRRSGRIDLWGFWSRRFRRLVPAMVVVILATLAAFRLWGAVAQRASVRGDALASLLYVANWRFVSSGQSYFDSLLEASPLRHAWSLAVEEQWYVVWPLVVVAVLAVSRRSLSALTGVVVGGIVASAVAMAVLYEPADPSRAYYGTDTRAHQLLVGALLAVVLSGRPLGEIARVRRRLEVPSLLALGFVLAAMLSVADTSPGLYRGGMLVFAALCALVILRCTEEQPTGLAAGLATRPLRWVGMRSYGIYLWHWPVIVLIDADVLGVSGIPLAVAQVAITLGLSALSHRLVETPARTAARRRFTITAWASGGLAAALALPILVGPAPTYATAESVRPTGTMPPVVPTVPPATTAATTAAPAAAERPRPTSDEFPGNRRTETEAAASPATTVPPTTVPEITVPPPPPRVLLLGDSTAVSLAVGIPPDVGQGARVWAEAHATVGCAITPGKPVGAERLPTDPSCLSMKQEWAGAVDTLLPDVVVVMVGAWEVLDRVVDGRRIRFGTPEWDSMVRTSLAEVAAIASRSGAQVRFMNVPCMQQAPDSLMPAEERNDPVRRDHLNALIAETVGATPNAAMLDLAGFLCPGGAYVDALEGVTLRYDGVHLTSEGAALTWRWLADQLTAPA